MLLLGFEDVATAFETIPTNIADRIIHKYNAYTLRSISLMSHVSMLKNYAPNNNLLHCFLPYRILFYYEASIHFNLHIKICVVNGHVLWSFEYIMVKCKRHFIIIVLTAYFLIGFTYKKNRTC